MSTNLKLAIEVVVNGVKTAGDAIKGLGEAFREGLREGASTEFAKAGKSLDELTKQANAARQALDLRPHAEIQTEIDKVKGAYESLKNSGVASAGEVAQAYMHAQAQIADLRSQTNGLAEAFGKVKGSAAAFAAGFGADTKAVAKSFDFETAITGISKLANMTDQELDGVRQDIRELAKTIPIPVEGLAKIGEAAAQLNLPAKQYRDFIDLVAKSASAFDIPVSTAGDSFGKLKNNFQLGLPGLRLVADSFNLLADSIANVKEGDLLNFTERLSAQGRSFGLTAQQVGAMGATLLSAGKAPEVAARAMESMLVKLQTADKAGGKFQQALGQMGLSGKQLADDIEKGPQQALTNFMQRLSGLSDRQRTSVLQDLFGADFANEVNILAQNFSGYSDALTKVGDASKYAGNVEQAFAQDAKTGNVQWQLAKQALQDFAIVVGDTLAPLAKVLTQALRDLAGVFSYLAEKFPTLTAAVAIGGPLLAGFSALKLLAGGVNLLLAKMIEGLLGTGVAAKLAFTAVRSALSLLTAFFVGWEIGTYLRNEFVEVRLFGIAMVKGLLLAWENLAYNAKRGWEAIRYAGEVMWEGIKFAFDKSIAVIKSKFGDMVVSIGRGMANIPGLKDEAADVVAYGESLKKSAAATEEWSQRMARIDGEHVKRLAAMQAENNKEVGTIRTVTDAMASDEIMKEAAKKAKAQAVPVGKDMAAGVAQGIEEGSPEAIAAMTTLVKKLEASARDEAETHSPSKAYARFGGDLIDGWVDGMVKRMAAREDEIAELAKKTAEPLTPKIDPAEVVPVAPEGRMHSANGQFVSRQVQGIVDGVEKANGPIAAGFAAYVETAGKAATNIRNAMERAFKGMEDALVNFVKTGKLDFKSLADSILSDLIRIQIQESITKPLASAMGSFNWGSLFGFAKGGTPAGISAWRNQIVDRPTFFANGGNVMGEAGPEAIMPLSRGPGGRLGVDASGLGAGNLTVNIINAPSQPKVEQRPDGNGGMRLDVIFEQIEGYMDRRMADGYGLARTMERRYGLNPAAGAWR